MVKSPFKNFTIAVTGDFGEQRGIEKMRQWIQFAGGIFVHEMSSKVTHLVCSKDNFKKRVNLVQQAQRLRTVKIVSFDWLEDSLMKRMPKNEREYLMGPRMQMEAEARAKKRYVRKKNIAKGLKKFEQGCLEFEKDMFSDGYGIYQDSTTFPYDITLARANLLTNKNERFVLKLHTSHAVPKLFCTTAKYSSPGISPKIEVLSPIGSNWEVAWQAWEKFFAAKTGKEWEGRFIKGDGVGMEKGEGFVYTPPREGEPRGLWLEV